MMKKLSPYIFPAIVLGLVFLLVFRWYTMRNDRMQSGLLSEGVIIENLSEDEVTALDAVEDFETAEMTATTEDVSGTVRYEVTDGRVTFTVSAVLPEDEAANYQVWLQEVDSETARHAFDLKMKKGGYIGSAAFSTDLLPIKVVVRSEASMTEEGAVLLETTLEAPEAE